MNVGWMNAEWMWMNKCEWMWMNECEWMWMNECWMNNKWMYKE